MAVVSKLLCQYVYIGTRKGEFSTNHRDPFPENVFIKYVVRCTCMPLMTSDVTKPVGRNLRTPLRICGRQSAIFVSGECGLSVFAMPDYARIIRINVNVFLS